MRVRTKTGRFAGALPLLLLLVLVTALAPGSPGARAADTPGFRYVRDVRSIAAAAAILRSEAETRGCDALLVVFERISFGPAPDTSVWTSGHRYRDDVPEWCAALDAVAADGRLPVFAAATTSPRPVHVEPGWADDVRDHLDGAWWDDRRFKRFPSSAAWVRRLAAGTRARRPAVAYIAGEFPPEHDIDVPDEQRWWRRKLRDAGEGFDAESVGEAVAARGGAFLVVAPEVRFGDHLPLADVPQFPWAPRPAAWRRDGPATATTTGGSRPRRRAIPGLGAGGRPREEVPGTDEEPDDTRDPGGRFHGSTARFHPGPTNTDAPSSYGHWPYARAAAKAGGVYVLYPFPREPWADDCPRYEPLVDALAPELVPAEDLARRLAADPVTEILAQAQRDVFDDTPWSDARGAPPAVGVHAKGDATSWFAWEFHGGLRRAVRWAPRDLPYDALGGAGTLDEWRRTGADLARTAARYDVALARLTDAAARIESGDLKGASRRSQANLRLARWWCAASAFHLHALSHYLVAIDDVLPDPPPDRILVTYAPALKMSDLLDAYDGRTITWGEERSYGWPAAFRLPGSQGNFLGVPVDDPEYRARRDADCALLRMDPRLVPHALRAIGAAREVMRCDGQSAWGWTTYYSDLDTFVWNEAPPLPKGPAPQTKSDRQRGPRTKKRGGEPAPGGPAPAGSTGGGATTK